MTTRFEDAVTKKQYRIYKLWHESTPGVRYVGMTTLPLMDRLFNHLTHLNQFYEKYQRTNKKQGGPRGGSKAKTDWLRSLISQGFAPHIDTLETLYDTFKEARAVEDHWMNFYLNETDTSGLPFTLLNAKLPKQAQTIVERKEPPVTDTQDYEQDKEVIQIVTEHEDGHVTSEWIPRRNYHHGMSSNDKRPIHHSYISGGPVSNAGSIYIDLYSTSEKSL